MLFGCCALSKYATQVKSIGYDYIEIEGSELAAEKPEADFLPVKERLAEAGIPVLGFNKFFTPGILFVGPKIDKVRNENYVHTAIGRAKALGAQNIGWGSPASRKAPPDFPKERALEQMREALIFMADVAAQYQMNILMESIIGKMEKLILTIKEATDMARSAGRPNVHVVADIYHMIHNWDPLQSMWIAGPDLSHVHFTELDRTTPGTNPAQLGMYIDAFRAMSAMGYDKSVSIEPDWGNDFEAEARLGLKTMQIAQARAIG
jgi:sugar phosphate isomerase/epimerase